MSDVRRWMRAVLPPTSVTLFAIAINIGAWAVLLALNWLANRDPNPEFSVLKAVVDEKATQAIFALIPCFTAAIYGLWRLLGRHPLSRPGYLEWLLRTPWRSPSPLPVGPVLPAWQDLIALAVLTVPAIGHQRLPWFAPAILAVVAYSLAALIVSLNRMPGAAFFAGLWALAAGVYFRESPVVVAVSATVLIISACRATASVLEELSERGENVSGQWSTPPEIVQHGPLGWPYDSLAPHSLQTYSTTHLVAIALTAGLAIAAIRLPIESEYPQSGIRFLIILAAVVFTIVRAGMFSSLAFPALSRLRSDPLVLSSLAIALTGFGLAWALVELPITGTNQFALAVSILLTLAFCLPPSRELWRLTSNARLTRLASRSRAQGRHARRSTR